MKIAISCMIFAFFVSIVACGNATPQSAITPEDKGTPRSISVPVQQVQPTPHSSVPAPEPTTNDSNEYEREKKMSSQIDIVASTFKIRVGNSEGTSFLLEQDSRRYLITAKHIGINIVDHVDLEWENGWLTVPVQVVGHTDDDTTVLRLEPEVDPARALLPEWTPPSILTGLKLAEDVRFYGFPLGMSTSRGPSTVPVPLVKNGIISGFYGTEGLGEDSSFWIDGHNNPGFSGGPVVSMRNGEFAISGVISGFYHSEGHVLSIDGQKSVIGTIRLNTGIIKAENIHGAMQIIAADK